MVKHYRENKYSKVMQIGSDYYITTNYRVIVENNWFEDLDYICEPTEWHEKRITVRFTTQIAVSREANRHRVDSVAEQSTRYCNYSKDKFGGEIAINKPKWVSEMMRLIHCLLMVEHLLTYQRTSVVMNIGVR